jgi:hypothetical protein
LPGEVDEMNVETVLESGVEAGAWVVDDGLGTGHGTAACTGYATGFSVGYGSGDGSGYGYADDWTE